MGLAQKEFGDDRDIYTFCDSLPLARSKAGHTASDDSIPDTRLKNQTS